MEAVYTDYRDKVQFLYVYKTLEHPGVNGFVDPIDLKERLKHVAIVKKQLGSEIPWICDNMDNDVKHAFGGAPNGEYILDPEGEVLNKRYWLNTKALRTDLEKFVGESETTTSVEDVAARFQLLNQPEIASGVVPKTKLPLELMPLNMEAIPNDDFPFYAKLRVESTPGILSGDGVLHLMVELDPIYEVHWNNAAGKVKVKLVGDDKFSFSKEEMEVEIADVEADIDPRQFLVPYEVGDVTGESSFRVKVSYSVCDNAETFCADVEQEYEVFLKVNKDVGNRPGIFLNKLFAHISGWDKNEDGEITLKELPKKDATLIMNNIDYNNNDVIEKDEADRFSKMFNNGNGIGPPDGKSADKEESADTETDDAESDDADSKGKKEEDASDKESAK